MAVTTYRWDDASAPQLGSTGDGKAELIRILKACLVDGYGAKAAAGWTVPFINVNEELAAFRNATTGGGSGTYFAFDEQNGYNIQAAQIRGYKNMSAVSTGTDPFPNSAQIGGAGMSIKKMVNNTPNDGSNGLAWIVVADQFSCHLFISPSSANTDYFSYTFFGDIISFQANDSNKGYLWSSGVTSNETTNWSETSMVQSDISGTTVGHYIARDITGLKVSQNAGVSSDMSLIDGKLGRGDTRYHTFPNPVDGNLIVSNVFVHEPTVLRGKIPGMKAACHNAPFSNLSTHVGDGDLAGKTFTVFNIGQGNDFAQVMIETSDTWYT